jgi:transcriptional regulator with XRE-family HTH domain
LRAHRDLAHLTRDQLAATTGVPVTVIIAYERGTRPPTDPDLATLAAALNRTPADFMAALGADDSFEYWGLITAAMPPMTSDQLASVVTILRRIDQRQHEHETRDRPHDRHKPV